MTSLLGNNGNSPSSDARSTHRAVLPGCNVSVPRLDQALLSQQTADVVATIEQNQMSQSAVPAVITDEPYASVRP
jgi:hypothetical protein